MHLNCNNFSINWARNSGLVLNWSPEKYLSRLGFFFLFLPLLIPECPKHVKKAWTVGGKLRVKIFWYIEMTWYNEKFDTLNVSIYWDELIQWESSYIERFNFLKTKSEKWKKNKIFSSIQWIFLCMKSLIVSSHLNILRDSIYLVSQYIEMTWYNERLHILRDSMYWGQNLKTEKKKDFVLTSDN